MCVPLVSAIGTGLELTTNVTQKALSLKQNTDNANYRTQVALNNMQSAKNEALRQQQLGIEEARKEKISGLKEANKLAARNSAGGLDVSSLTSQYGYNDVLDSAYSDAKSIQDEYNLRADNYMEKANNYLTQAKQSKSSMKNYLLDFALTSIGQTGVAAKKWYKDYQDKLEKENEESWVPRV